MNVILTDGSSRAFEGENARDLAKAISQKLAKAAIAAEVNGEVVSLLAPLKEGDRVSILTFDDPRAQQVYRHSASHVLAQAVLRLFPDRHVKLGIGPAIDNGFYYDFDLDGTISVEDLAAIKAVMEEIVKENLPISKSEMNREQALAWAADRPYKRELIEDLPEDVALSFYHQGEFTDLCAGPHLPSTGYVKHFELTTVAGAYWRGDEKRPMMQRIYAVAFDSKQALEEYLARMEEAKKRDHRKLGRELDLFSLLDEGHGFPFFHPNGMVVKNELINLWKKIHYERGYEEVSTPMLLNADLWRRSGHWGYYRQNMYTLEIDEQEHVVKPMNCPGGILMFMRKQWSYRELPVRMGELGVVHRHELSGALHGLMRVRCFTQDDAHIFMTKEQIKDEIIGVLDLTETVYNLFGFRFHVELSTRPENSMGTDEQWNEATRCLREALEEKGWDFVVNEGDGAFYGPKIDIHLEDCMGRTWQCGTVQLDFQLPERFELTYDGADGEKHQPVMIHRVVFGSIERFIGILTEHFAGAFPLWLSPVQAKVMTITSRADEAAQDAVSKLRTGGMRANADLRNEKIGYKIRASQMEKVPYMLVIGDREAQEGLVSVRKRGEGEIGTMSVEAFLAIAQREIAEKTIF